MCRRTFWSASQDEFLILWPFFFFHRWNYTRLSLLFSYTKASSDQFYVIAGPRQGKGRVGGCFPVALGCRSKVVYNNPTTIIQPPPCLRWLLMAFLGAAAWLSV